MGHTQRNLNVKLNLSGIDGIQKSRRNAQLKVPPTANLAIFVDPTAEAKEAKGGQETQVAQWESVV